MGDPNLLSPITHRSEAGQRELVKLKVREALVRARVNQMNSVRFPLKSFGGRVPASVKATAFVCKLRAQADAIACSLVEPFLEELYSPASQPGAKPAQLLRSLLQ